MQNRPEGIGQDYQQRTVTNKNNQPMDQEITKLKAEIETLKIITHIGNINMDYTHQNPQKIQTKRKSKKVQKWTKGLQTRGQIEKIEITSVISLTEDTMRTLLVKLWRHIEEPIRCKSDPEGNAVNLKAFYFSKREYKLLNKNFNFIFFFYSLFYIDIQCSSDNLQ